jgi:hypothetical protein
MTATKVAEASARPTPTIVEGSLESAPAVYVDGLAQMTSGPVMSKLHFFQVEKIGRSAATPVEHRKVVQTLIIPTAVLAEFASNVLKGLAQNRTNLLSGYDANRLVLEKLLDQVTIESNPT